jgi:hypothetical protein
MSYTALRNKRHMIFPILRIPHHRHIPQHCRWIRSSRKPCKHLRLPMYTSYRVPQSMGHMNPRSPSNTHRRRIRQCWRSSRLRHTQCNLQPLIPYNPCRAGRNKASTPCHSMYSHRHRDNLQQHPLSRWLHRLCRHLRRQTYRLCITAKNRRRIDPRFSSSRHRSCTQLCCSE